MRRRQRRSVVQPVAHHQNLAPLVGKPGHARGLFFGRYPGFELGDPHAIRETRNRGMRVARYHDDPHARLGKGFNGGVRAPTAPVRHCVGPPHHIPVFRAAR